jgi:hypothetical protein
MDEKNKALVKHVHLKFCKGVLHLKYVFLVKKKQKQKTKKANN